MSDLPESYQNKPIDDIHALSAAVQKEALDKFNAFTHDQKTDFLNHADLPMLHFLLSAAIRYEDYKLCEVVSDLIVYKSE